jgi:hypothetical protein
VHAATTSVSNNLDGWGKNLKPQSSRSFRQERRGVFSCTVTKENYTNGASRSA